MKMKGNPKRTVHKMKAAWRVTQEMSQRNMIAAYRRCSVAMLVAAAAMNQLMTSNLHLEPDGKETVSGPAFQLE
jgi:hypothetical protein